METLYPAADFRQITANITPDRRRVIRGFTPHVQVGNGSLFGFFNTPKPPNEGGSADFWISKRGVVEQYVNLGTHRPWSQGTGSASFVSVEFEGFPEEPMTKAQIDAGGKLLAWLIQQGYDIPLEVHEDKSASGLVPHFAWWNENYHTCPQGPNFKGPRYNQYHDLIAAARFFLGVQPVPALGEDGDEEMKMMKSLRMPGGNLLIVAVPKTNPNTNLDTINFKVKGGPWVSTGGWIVYTYGFDIVDDGKGGCDILCLGVDGHPYVGTLELIKGQHVFKGWYNQLGEIHVP